MRESYEVIGSMNPFPQAHYAWQAPAIMTDHKYTKPDTHSRVLIIGLGKTGLSCARFLARRGISFMVMDDREQPPELPALRQQFPGTEIFLGEFKVDVIASCDLIIISPGVSLFDPAIARIVESGIPVVGDIELFAQYADAPVAAITGSNGKSTVTALVAEMARMAGRDVRMGGNFGTPALDLLENGPPDLYVLELSSFQLESTWSLNCAAAVVLNLSPDHLDRYRSMDEYRAAKLRIYRGDGVVVINGDEPLINESARASRKCLRFSTGLPGQGEFGLRSQRGELWFAKGDECLMPVSSLRISGFHNVSNALAALALGDTVGLPTPAMLEALKTFTGLPHRMEWITQHEGVTWYNDSKGTNVGATMAALQGLYGKVVLIAGGLGKGAEFSVLRAVVAEKGRAVVLIGRDAPLIEKALANVVPVIHAADMYDAVHQARRCARSGDSVLLSPACASFDMFRNYEHRGQVFVAAVRSELS